MAPPHLSNVLFLSAKALLDRKFSQSERLLPYAIGEEDEFRPKAENSAQQELQDFLYMVGGPEAEEQEDIDHLIDGPWVLHGHEDERDDTPDYACREAFFRMYSQGVHERNNGLVSPRSKYLRKTKELQIAPSPSGVVRSGEMDKIDLHCRGIGDDYATALAESFEGGDGVRSLNLRDNRLSVRGASSLLSSIVNSPEAIDELTELDLSYNRLSSETLRHLQTVISSAKGLTRLQYDLGLMRATDPERYSYVTSNLSAFCEVIIEFMHGRIASTTPTHTRVSCEVINKVLALLPFYSKGMKLMGRLGASSDPTPKTYSMESIEGHAAAIAFVEGLLVER